jgi:hypothetical protein
LYSGSSMQYVLFSITIADCRAKKSINAWDSSLIVIGVYFSHAFGWRVHCTLSVLKGINLDVTSYFIMYYIIARADTLRAERRACVSAADTLYVSFCLPWRKLKVNLVTAARCWWWNLRAAWPVLLYIMYMCSVCCCVISLCLSACAPKKDAAFGVWTVCIKEWSKTPMQCNPNENQNMPI